MSEISKGSGLKGHLEDLPLLDMLQIVAFSKKTGFLHLEGSFGNGGVVFKEGLVVCAYSWSTLKYLRQIGDDPQGGYPIAILQKQIEISLRELASLREGKFHFQVTNSVPNELDGIPIAPFLLHQGINPEALLLDLAKEMDEERRETGDLLEAAAPPPLPAPHEVVAKTGSPETSPPRPPAEPESPSTSEVPSPPAATSPDPPTLKATLSAELKPPIAGIVPPIPISEEKASILLVDDEDPVRQVLGTVFRDAGHRVYTASTPSEALGLASEVALTGERLLVVTDLGMPTTSGRSFRGGFELARTLKRNGVEVPILLMTDKLSHKARERAKTFGVSRIALKPGLSKLDHDQYEKDLRGFATKILHMLKGLTVAAPIEDDVPLEAGGEDANSAPFLDFITSMSAQLISPRRSADISQLVVQAASKYLERGILFLIKGEMANGLAGFGLVSTEEGNLEVAKSISFNIHQARPFAEVAYSGKTERFSSELDCLQPSLYAAIGRGRATESVLMPMLNNGEVLVILYGDNASSGRAIGKLRGLELFMGQAGMALENSFLHKKIRVFESKLSGGPSEENVVSNAKDG